MSDQVALLFAQKRIISDLLEDADIRQRDCAQNMCALALGPDLAAQYARSLGEFEATKAFAHRLRDKLGAIEKELEILKPST